MSPTVIGFLPLYLELYDRVLAEMRPTIDAFAATIAGELEKEGFTVLAAPVCRVKAEFEAAIRDFEAGGAVAIVTLHLAYSPSLESADALAATKLPLIVLDTTPDYDFGLSVSAERILYNHGIHGVQDMCNLLLRNRKPFLLEAGHWQESDVLRRVGADVRACRAAAAMKGARVGLIGKPFPGMGDFSIPFADLQRQIGLQVVESSAPNFSALRVSAEEIAAEVAAYTGGAFELGKISEACLARTAETSLRVRKWCEREGLNAFTFNFSDITRDCGLSTVPFLEASLAMSRGVGYAGEGDVLTAALVAALAAAFPEVTFGEMFCPDWKGNMVFLSHMGELNVQSMRGRPRLIESELPYYNIDYPGAAHGCMKSGAAALVNVAPGPDGTYSLIVCSGQMRVSNAEAMPGVSGWFEPAGRIEDMLAEYSRHGGTHHLAIVYAAELKILAGFSQIMNWSFVHI